MCNACLSLSLPFAHPLHVQLGRGYINNVIIIPINTTSSSNRKCIDEQEKGKKKAPTNSIINIIVKQIEQRTEVEASKSSWN